jgi:hypothetical protein
MCPSRRDGALKPGRQPKPHGSDGNSFLGLGFELPSDQDAMELRIADVQLEPGSVATPFERRPVALGRALCART